MKKTFLLIASLCLVMGAMAVPARRGTLTVKQPDGTTIQIVKHGDEHFHYITDIQGQWLKQDAQGRYVVTDALTDEQIRQRRMQSPKLKTQIRRVQQSAQTAIPLNIADRGLIILVNFQDVSFKSANTLEAMQEMLSGDNYTYGGATGSALRYFQDQSLGKYNPQFDVVGPVTVSQNMSYYGSNDSQGNDRRPENMIIEACNLADSQFDVDFTQYDNNNDGFVDFVYVIYAGYGEADSEQENTIWPHAWTLDDAGKTCTVDNKKINTYACGSELNYDGNRNGIGTFCHEFSHVCGLPDFYETTYSSLHKTLGDWDILDSGPYNNNGNTPPAYSAYERFFCGWLTPEYIHTESQLSLEELQASNKAYIITTSSEPNLVGNDPNPTTFYLVENRQQTGWDKYIPGHGMLLTKIAYNYTTWTENTVNDVASSMGVDLIEADGKAPKYSRSNPDNGYYGKATDAFPAGATSYTKVTNRSITDITETNGVISFKFMDGNGTIVEPTPQGNLLTVTEAVELASTLASRDITTDTTEVYGEVTDIQEIETTTYGNATFTITDGKSNILCYRIYNIGNSKFTSQDQLKVGDKVIVRSLIQNYYSTKTKTNTYELVKGYVKEINPTISALENVEALDYTLIAADGQLSLTQPQGHTMHVLNAIGQTIYNGVATTLSLPHGLYVVRIDNTIYKISL